MSTSQGKILRSYLRVNNISIESLKELLDISRQTIYNWFEKDILDDEIIERLEKKAQISRAIFVKTKLDKKGIPVYNIDFTAGELTQFSDEPNRIIGSIDLNGFRNCIAFVQVKGSSMYPEFTAGDLIGIEPLQSFDIIQYGQPFAIETKDNQRMIKIIRRGKDDDNLILRSTNKEYDDIHIHKSKIQKLYKVHGPVRDQWQ